LPDGEAGAPPQTPGLKIFLKTKPAQSLFLKKTVQLIGSTAFKLFHNHLVVDTLLSVFPFGSEEFVRLRELFWLEVFGSAAISGISCIFTFAPEKTVRPTFIKEALKIIKGHKGKVIFVELLCDDNELEKRIEEPFRRSFGKLQSIQRWRELQEEGAFVFPKIDSEIILETTTLSPDEAARKIFKAIE
jgi:hypothetical protein